MSVSVKGRVRRLEDRTPERIPWPPMMTVELKEDGYYDSITGERCEEAMKEQDKKFGELCEQYDVAEEDMPIKMMIVLCRRGGKNEH